MQTVVLYLVSITLATLPLMMAAFFLIYTVPRKILEVQIDLSKLGADRAQGSAGLFFSSAPEIEREARTAATPDRNGSSGTEEPAAGGDVERLIRKYLRTSALIVPAVILTTLYLAAFLLCDAHLLYNDFGHRGLALFSAQFLAVCTPTLYAFIGVYTFNLGTMTRRVYLGDMNEQVFWGAINRLILSVGLAIVVMRIPGSSGSEGPFIFFAIGFLANIVLQWVLERTLKFLNMGRPGREDLPLQMVRGINMWKEYRLEEEGIESVQNMATANILELAARTHYNLRTLIDWIDQSIVLSALTTEQVNILNNQGFPVSAIGLAAASPDFTGNNRVSDELAKVLNVSEILMANTLNSLYQDLYLRELWSTWQSGREHLPMTTGIPVPAGAPAAAPDLT